MSTIDENFKWFMENKETIKKENKILNNDYIVISNKKFIKKFETYNAALIYAETKLAKEGYIIQKLSDLESKNNCFGYIGKILHA